MGTTEITIIGAIFLLLGGLLAWVFTRLWFKSKLSRREGKHREALAEWDTKYREALHQNEKERNTLESKLAAQQENVQQLKETLADTFKSAASDALKHNNAQFLELAQQSMKTQAAEAKGTLDEKKAAIAEMLKPLSESIGKYQQRIESLEKNSGQTFGQVTEMLNGLRNTQAGLQKETHALVSALKDPKVRGKWGEIGLERLVEFSGMSEHCDFQTQVHIKTQEGSANLRPDMLIHLPGKRMIVVDSKLPLNAYLAAYEAESDEDREGYMAKHASNLKKHIGDLSKKQYWNQFDETPDFVILYMGIESAFGAAMSQDHELLQYGIDNNIIIASPSNLIAMLKSIALSWQQQTITDNAKEIFSQGKELHERLYVFYEHMENVGKGLGKAVGSFNKAVSSWDRRIHPSIRKLEELGAKSNKNFQPAMETIDGIIDTPKELPKESLPGE